MKRLRGATDLVFDIIEETTQLVQRTQRSAWSRSVRVLGTVPPLAPPARALQTASEIPSRAAYGAILGFTRGFRGLTQTALGAAESALGEGGPRAPPTPMRSDAARTLPWWLDHAEAVLNGLWGSHLFERGNGLDMGMTLRWEGQPLALTPDALSTALPDPTAKIVLFIHGLNATEWCWTYRSDDLWGDPTTSFGTRLHSDWGYTPLFVRYNSGRHISENGAALSELLERVVETYPLEVEEIVIIGHSMGGLVARSAAHLGSTSGTNWASKLRRVFCLGSPNLGAPLEKGVNLVSGVLKWFDTAGTQVPAQLLDLRSAGVKDLRFGYTTEEEWRDEDPDAILRDNRQVYPLPAGVGYYYVAATTAQSPDSGWGYLVGDLLVRPPSASGKSPDPARRIPFRSGRIFGGMHHLLIASHPDVYAAISQMLEDGGPNETRPRASDSLDRAPAEEAVIQVEMARPNE